MSFKNRHRIVREESIRAKAYNARYEAAYEFLSKAVDDKSSQIADLGCGDGVFLSRVIDEYPNLIGLDLSVKSLDYIRSYPTIKDVELINGDIEALPFGDDELPVVVCIEALEHLTDVGKGLKEIHRVLKPNGILIVTVPFAFNPRNIMAVGDRKSKTVSFFRGLFRVIAGIDQGYVVHKWRDSQGYEFPHRVYSRQKIRSMLENAKFTIRRITNTPLSISNHNGISIGARIEKAINDLTNNYFGESIVVLAQKRAKV
ncbi:MAG: class I SAM-dependent methyltransferase [candidate division WOR-3 bacterium]|nr:class I SAM-dependent methyltransferase [candidate division WOR-3 bacterium]